jgi:CubicO group peptidase (beta-lactamase class C family)
MKASCFFLLLLLAKFSVLSQTLYFPPVNNQTWETKSLEELGWCQEPVDQLLELLDQNGTKAFILLKDGKIVIESYFDSHTQDSYWYWASAGKTVVAFLTGLAQEKGFLSITDTTSNIIGQGWTSATVAKEEKITIWHQLTMTSGLDDGVEDNHCTDPQCLVFKANAGTRWSYHNAPYTLLEDVLESSTTLGLNQLTNQWLKEPPGMNGFFLKQGFNNVFFSNARSMARFGLLVLNRGNWDGFKVMEDLDYLDQMVSTSQDLNPSYGYLWWLNGKSSFMLPGLQFSFSGPMFPNSPSDLVVAAGLNGQLINVVPSQNLIWIRKGNAPDGSLVPVELNNIIWEQINKLGCTSSSNNFDSEIKETVIFPNPANDYIQIEAKSPIRRVEILDFVGKRLSVYEAEGGLRVDNARFSLPNMTPGAYIVLVYFKEGGFLTKKLIIN